MTQTSDFKKICAWCGKAIEYSGHFGLGGLLKKSPTEQDRRVGEIMRSVITSVKKVGFDTRIHPVILNGNRTQGFLIPSCHTENRLDIIFLGCSGECTFELKRTLEMEKAVDVEMNLWVLSSYGL